MGKNEKLATSIQIEAGNMPCRAGAEARRAAIEQRIAALENEVDSACKQLGRLEAEKQDLAKMSHEILDSGDWQSLQSVMGKIAALVEQIAEKRREADWGEELQEIDNQLAGLSGAASVLAETAIKLKAAADSEINVLTGILQSAPAARGALIRLESQIKLLRGESK